MVISVALLSFISEANATSESELNIAVNKIVAYSATEQKDVPARGLLGIQNGEVLFSVTTGKLIKAGEKPFTQNTPLRIASNTKTYVAATVFKLVEQKALSLDEGIVPLIEADVREYLTEAGYQVDAIKIHHLLSHTAGMRDHAVSEEYLTKIISEPTYRWQPKQQIKMMAGLGKPLFEPGADFKYSDTGYVLLGQIIEKVTSSPLHTVVRQQLDLNNSKFSHTWWDRFEQGPEGVERAHQYYNGIDATSWDPSVDLYGGGGMISTLKDMAMFTDALFNHQVYRKKQSLSAMQNESGLPEPESYLYGLTVSQIGGEKAIGHSGFWGTVSFHFPDLNLTISGVVTAQKGYKRMIDDIGEVVAAYKRSRKNPQD